MVLSSIHLAGHRIFLLIYFLFDSSVLKRILRSGLQWASWGGKKKVLMSKMQKKKKQRNQKNQKKKKKKERKGE